MVSYHKLGFNKHHIHTLGALFLFTNKDEGHEFYYLEGGSAAAKTAPNTYDEFDLTDYKKITVRLRLPMLLHRITMAHWLR